MTVRKDAAALHQRELRIREYIDMKMSASEIAQREGMQENYALKERKRIAIKHGITTPLDGRSPAVPYGIDKESRLARSRLADYLANWIRDNNVTPIEVTKRIGIPRKLQKKATITPMNYDWTLSQMQRLAKALDMSFETMMKALAEDMKHVTV